MGHLSRASSHQRYKYTSQTRPRRTDCSVQQSLRLELGPLPLLSSPQASAMSKYARDHAHCGDQTVQSRGHPSQRGRGPFHAPPDQADFTRTNSTVFNPKILEASIREIASCLADGAKADLLLYAAKKLDISRERCALVLYARAASPCAITPPSAVVFHRARFTSWPAFEPGSIVWFGSRVGLWRGRFLRLLSLSMPLRLNFGPKI